VVVHPKATVATVTLQEAADVFLGRTREMRDGTLLIPLDQRKNPDLRSAFYLATAKKTQAQLKAYWARQVFTGQGEPPLTVIGDDAVKRLVSQNPNMIGYIDAEKVDESVRSVLLIRQ
jgi:ABC-type phosphate transport system substrate-binding protein